MRSRHDSSLIFGVAEGQLVHISEVERGLLCECHCPLCHEPLVAKKGDELSHHFSHTSVTSCTPNPETLTHRFAKELIARQLWAVLPALEARVQYENHAGHVAEAWGREPHSMFEADSAEVESQEFGDVVPDVLLRKGNQRLMVEVHFRHPVPEEKVERIELHHWPAVEVSLSDLPTESSPARIAAALADTRRWRWLYNRLGLRGDIHKCLVASHGLYFPKFQHLPTLRCATQLPNRRLATAEAMVPKATAWIEHSRVLSPEARERAYLTASLDLRLAIHCVWLGLRPLALPLNLMQKTRGQSILTEHAMYWQSWLFCKFCIGEQPFTAHDVTRAARRIFESLSRPHRTIQTDNGFSAATILFYEFLLQLARQGLVARIDGQNSWQHAFRPVVRTRKEARSLLSNFPPACGLNVTA